MAAIITSILKNLVEVMIFVFIAWAGIICGKKWKDSKGTTAKNQDTK